MCTTTNCENSFVSETKSQAHVGEKSTLSGGGLDPSLQRWLSPVVASDAEKAGVNETVWLQCCLPLWQTPTRPYAQASTVGQRKDHVLQLLIEPLK